MPVFIITFVAAVLTLIAVLSLGSVPGFGFANIGFLMGSSLVFLIVGIICVLLIAVTCIVVVRNERLGRKVINNDEMK